MSRRGWVLFGLMSVIWGVPYLLIKVADGGVSVPVLVFARVAIGSAVLLPLAIRRGQIRVLAGRWRWLALFAVVEIMLPWALLSDAERHLSSSLTGLLIAVVPIIGLVLARLTGGPEQLTAVRWAGLLAGLAGVALLAGLGDHAGASGASGTGIAIILFASVCWAVGTILSTRLKGLPQRPFLTTAMQMLVGGAIILALSAATGEFSGFHLSQVSLRSWLALLYLIGPGSILALSAYGIAVRSLPTSTVATYAYVNPVVAVILGTTILSEKLTPMMLVGGALIVAAVALIVWRRGSPGH